MQLHWYKNILSESGELDPVLLEPHSSVLPMNYSPFGFILALFAGGLFSGGEGEDDEGLFAVEETVD